MDLLEIKKQHVLAYHWPSSGLILNNVVRMLYNYCKRTLVLGSHRLHVWLDIAYSKARSNILNSSVLKT